MVQGLFRDRYTGHTPVQKNDMVEDICSLLVSAINALIDALLRHLRVLESSQPLAGLYSRGRIGLWKLKTTISTGSYDGG